MMCGTNNPHQERFNLVNANTPRTFHICAHVTFYKNKAKLTTN